MLHVGSLKQLIIVFLKHNRLEIEEYMYLFICSLVGGYCGEGCSKHGCH